MQRRVGNLKVSDLRSTVDHFRQGLQHFWIAAAEIGFRVLFLVPKTDSDPFRSGSGGDEDDFVLEAVLFLKERKNLLLDCLGKLRTGIGLQFVLGMMCLCKTVQQSRWTRRNNFARI